MRKVQSTSSCFKMEILSYNSSGWLQVIFPFGTEDQVERAVVKVLRAPLFSAPPLQDLVLCLCVAPKPSVHAHSCAHFSHARLDQA